MASLGIVIMLAPVAQANSPAKTDLSDYGDQSPQEILLKAAQRGDMPAVREVLDEKVDINGFPDAGRQTALDAAAGAGQKEVLAFLLSEGADVNLHKGDGPNALRMALENGRTDCAALLSAHGATCDPALLAAAKADETVLAPILKKQPADFNQLRLLARIAAANGHADTLREIIGAVRNIPGQSHWSVDDGAVLTAVARGYRDVVLTAIETSPFRDTLNKGGVMRLAGAAAQSPGMRDWLIANGYSVPEYTDGEKLIDATEREDLPEMARLLKAGADVNYRGESSWTPITKAAAWNKVHSTKFLLAHGADPNSVHLPGWGYTPICLTSTPAIADMLLKAGGKINATLYNRGVHIMDYAVTFGYTDMVKWYIAHGVDPAKAQGDGADRTLLFDAPNPEIAELLIDHGIDVNAKDKEGQTALHWICMRNQKPAETVKVLLDHGADPSAKDKQGRTPLMMTNDAATIKLLTKYEAGAVAKCGTFRLTPEMLASLDNTDARPPYMRRNPQ